MSERSSHRIRRWGCALLVSLSGIAAIAGAQDYDTPSSLLLQGTGPTDSDRIVSQDEWAADLVDVMGLDAALPEDHTIDDVFSLLCAAPVEVAPGTRGRLTSPRAALRVTALPPPRAAPDDPIRTVVSVPATALYLLSVEGVGAQRWAVDQKPVGHLDPSSLGVAHAPAMVPLRRGPHELTAFLTRGARVERIELSAQQPLCIAPAEGWRAGRPLTFGAMARTLVGTLGLERRLPADGTGIPIEAERFDTASPWGGRTNRALATPASGRVWVTASGGPAEFTWLIRVAEPGLYTVMARLHGDSAQIWSIDGHYRMSVSPRDAGDGFAWAQVMTLELATGKHEIRGLLPRGAGVDVLRVERRRATDADQVAVIEEAGFRGGPPDGFVTRSAAWRHLDHPSFAPLAENLLQRMAGSARDHPLILVELDRERRYSRPLSPVLGPEL